MFGRTTQWKDAYGTALCDCVCLQPRFSVFAGLIALVYTVIPVLLGLY